MNRHIYPLQRLSAFWIAVTRSNLLGACTVQYSVAYILNAGHVIGRRAANFGASLRQWRCDSGDMTVESHSTRMIGWGGRDKRCASSLSGQRLSIASTLYGCRVLARESPVFWEGCERETGRCTESAVRCRVAETYECGWLEGLRG